MTKDVLYTGLTRQPDDNLSADGTLALCHNLINEDGALRPIPQPRKILSLGDYKILTIHTQYGLMPALLMRSYICSTMK